MAITGSGDGKFKVEDIFTTSPQNNWLCKKERDYSLDKLTADSSVGECEAEYSLAKCLTRKVGAKEQRVLVFSDVDAFTNGLMTFGNPHGNLELNINIALYMTYGKYPIVANGKRTNDTSSSLTLDDMKWMNFLFLILVPGILVICSVVFLLKRKNK